MGKCSVHPVTHPGWRGRFTAGSTLPMAPCTTRSCNGFARSPAGRGSTSYVQVKQAGPHGLCAGEAGWATYHVCRLGRLIRMGAILWAWEPSSGRPYGALSVPFMRLQHPNGCNGLHWDADLRGCVSGHSMGGAVATVCCRYLAEAA